MSDNIDQDTVEYEYARSNESFSAGDRGAPSPVRADWEYTYTEFIPLFVDTQEEAIAEASAQVGVHSGHRNGSFIVREKRTTEFTSVSDEKGASSFTTGSTVTNTVIHAEYRTWDEFMEYYWLPLLRILPTVHQKEREANAKREEKWQRQTDEYNARTKR